MIPKILHQTYKSATLPMGFQIYRQSWLQQTPDWEHHLWLDSDNRALVANHYPWFLETFDAYQDPINRVDAARIFMMHRFGGVYADLDIEAIQDPAPLFTGGQELAFFHDWASWKIPNASSELGITNSLMASVPGHPFWIAMARRMVKYRFFAEERSDPLYKIFIATGPMIFSVQVSEYMRTQPEAVVDVFPKKYWTPFEPNLDEDPCDNMLSCRESFPSAILVSHWTGTWRKDKCGSHLDPAYEAEFCAGLRRERGDCE